MSSIFVYREFIMRRMDELFEVETRTRKSPWRMKWKGVEMMKAEETVKKPLAGRIALVAGATRGAGRGIAQMLGEAGATVYCTGRSVRGEPPASGIHKGRTETIEETAEMVS